MLIISPFLQAKPTMNPNQNPMVHQGCDQHHCHENELQHHRFFLHLSRGEVHLPTGKGLTSEHVPSCIDIEGIPSVI